LLLADFPKPLEMLLDLVCGDARSAFFPGAFRLFDGFDVLGPQGAKMCHSSALLVAHLDWFSRLQHDPGLFRS
jgi:hypothetical protein